MKIINIKSILVLAACVAANTNTVLAQRARKIGNGPDVSINISNNDSVKTTYFNVGLLTNIANQKGIGINIISSTVRKDMTGLQTSGFVNITGNSTKGIQLSGLSNVVGNRSNGVMISGLINVTGKQMNGFQTSLFANIVGNKSNSLAVGGLLNIAGNEMNGVHLAGLANIAARSQNCVAIAGLMNASAQTVKGCQITSLLNIAGEEANGLQLSAISNVAVNAKGVQLTGLTNIAAESMTGLQFAGAVNIATKTRCALQVSGITNICQGKMKGVQFAPANYSGEMDGVQIGLLNMCEGKTNGLQIGIINHSKDSTAHRLGLVNISPSTRIQMMAYTGNTSKINVAARFKNKKTYSIIGIGTHYLGLDSKFSGTVFYRTGLHFPIAPKLELSGDLGYYHIESFENEDEKTPERMYSIQGRLNLEYQIQKKISIFASGGYGVTRYYDKNKFFEKKPIFALGVVLF